MSPLAEATELKRVTLGFTGGLTLSRQVGADELARLRSALDQDAAWFELETKQETVVIALARLVFVEFDSTDRRVGFD